MTTQPNNDDWSLDSLADTAADARLAELRQKVGGPALDLKQFLKGDATHEQKLNLVTKLEQLLRNPLTAEVAVDSSGASAQQPRLAIESGGATDDPQVTRFKALLADDSNASDLLLTLGEQVRNTDHLTKKHLRQVLDGADGQKVVDDGTGQPATETALALQRTLREVEAREERVRQQLAAIVNDHLSTVQKAKDLAEHIKQRQQSMPADQSPFVGEDALVAQLDQLNKLEQALTAAKTAADSGSATGKFGNGSNRQGRSGSRRSGN